MARNGHKNKEIWLCVCLVVTLCSDHQVKDVYFHGTKKRRKFF